MKTLNVLHITDLHFGYDGADSDSDSKKSAVSEELLNELVVECPKQSFCEDINNGLIKNPVDVIAFTGDLQYAPKGQDKLNDGVEYLKKIGGLLGVKNKNIFIAPGNHDLDRSDSKKALNRLESLCQEAGFSYCGWKNIETKSVNDIPILIVNTCLGGTEHAYYGGTGPYWDKMTSFVKSIENSDDLPEELKSQLTALDIPAIGNTQIGEIKKALSKPMGNFSIILGHHNLLPTHTTIIRPFASIIDSGRVVYLLLESNKRIFFLHGHTHQDSALFTRSPEDKKSGFIASIGCTGLHELSNEGTPSVTYIEFIFNNNGDFRFAKVSIFQWNKRDFKPVHIFPILDITKLRKRLPEELRKIEPGKDFYFGELAEDLGIDDENKLTEILLEALSSGRIEIKDIEGKKSDWLIRF
jgi:predicted MPP superfamily phosphohydrolase